MYNAMIHTWVIYEKDSILLWWTVYCVEMVYRYGYLVFYYYGYFHYYYHLI